MKILKYLFYFALFIILFAEFFIHSGGFNSLYGFWGCILLIIISKFLGKNFLQKKDDYYE